MTPTTPSSTLDPVLTLSQLATQLGVSVQTLYDLRCQGRGPRGFRVGRELRFRVSEIDAWIRQNAETKYHPVGTVRMGADEKAPLDEELRVRGIESLRDIDPSVKKKLIGGNTNAPTI